MKRHSREPEPSSRAFDVGEPKQNGQRGDLSAASDPILTDLDRGVGRDIVTGWAFGVLVLAALVLVVLHFSDIAELITLARSARPEWLLLAVLAQGGTYLCAGSVLREALKQAGRKVPLRRLATLGLVKLFADQAVPSVGLSGTILLLRGLARRDIPATMTMSALLVDVVSYYGAYLTAVLIGVGLLWVNHRANAAVLAGATIFATVGALCAGADIPCYQSHADKREVSSWTSSEPDEG
jgi:uncharacterized membrane protein YbhN (UPF0104 family)